MKQWKIHKHLAPWDTVRQQRGRWPISRCQRVEECWEWEFVEHHEGTYEAALKRAWDLQQPGVPWQYRIWDCR